MFDRLNQVDAALMTALRKVWSRDDGETERNLGFDRLCRSLSRRFGRNHDRWEQLLVIASAREGHVLDKEIGTLYGIVPGIVLYEQSPFGGFFPTRCGGMVIHARMPDPHLFEVKTFGEHGSPHRHFGKVDFMRNKLGHELHPGMMTWTFPGESPSYDQKVYFDRHQCERMQEWLERWLGPPT